MAEALASCDPEDNGSYMTLYDILQALNPGEDDSPEVVSSQNEVSLWRALVTAARDGNTEGVKSILGAGPGENLDRYYKNMALVEASRGGHLDIVKCMIKSGAIVNDNLGLALYEAVVKGYMHIINYLILWGADVNRRDANGQTPLMIAVVHGKSDIVKFIIQAGVDVNTANADGQTALMIGAHRGCADIVQTLLNAGADVNKSDKKGHTALVEAAKEGHEAVADILINSGADVNVICGTTYSIDCSAVHINALFCLATKCNVKGVHLLLKLGAAVNTYKSRLLPLKILIQNNKMRKLLFAAGQNISILSRKHRRQMCGNYELQNLCRMAIRDYLLQLNAFNNLFCRIPRLGLPSALVRYLLYDFSLDDDDNDDDDDDVSVTSSSTSAPISSSSSSSWFPLSPSQCGATYCPSVYSPTFTSTSSPYLSIYSPTSSSSHSPSAYSSTSSLSYISPSSPSDLSPSSVSSTPSISSSPVHYH